MLYGLVGEAGGQRSNGFGHTAQPETRNHLTCDQPRAKASLCCSRNAFVEDLLQCLRVFAVQNPVVQRFIFDAAFVELAGLRT